jgi:hypothetical protein
MYYNHAVLQIDPEYINDLIYQFIYFQYARISYVV